MQLHKNVTFHRSVKLNIDFFDTLHFILFCINITRETLHFAYVMSRDDPNKAEQNRSLKIITELLATCRPNNDRRARKK